VREGTLEAGSVATRGWDLEGITSLRALQAPFLITTDDLLNQVVTAPFAADMLSGLQRAGVTGLALLPEALRHPFGFEGPLSAPEDFVGAVIQSPLSDISYDLLRSLGASPMDVHGDAFNDGVRH